jgi:hypothetical protein
MSNKKLQKVQNAAARITLRMPRTEHTTPLLRMLHWLPISSRIAYKIDSICHTSLTTAYPKYLSELLTVYTPARPLRSSSDPNILNVATTRTKSYGQRTFAYQGPSNWNRVPGEVRRIEDMFAFRRKLKTSLFHQQD